MDHRLFAGAAEIDITPGFGTQIAGDIGRRRPALVVLDPLYARALVLEGESESVCIISMDLLAATKEKCDAIRGEVAARHGIPAENVAVHVTQNHAAPSLGHLMVTPDNSLLPKEKEWDFLRGGDEEYAALCIERVLNAVGEAVAGKQRARVGAAREIDGRFTFNRRAVMRDGRRIAEPAKNDKNILYIDGPTDPEVGVVLFTNDALENIAVMLHYTSHPTSGYPRNFITADWPGAWCARMKGVLGGGCVPLVINGCCGNLGTDNKLDAGNDRNDYAGVGAGLAQTAVKALKDLSYIDAGPLSAAGMTLRIPLREFPEDYLANARNILREHPTPKWNDSIKSVEWDWWIAMSALDANAYFGAAGAFDYEIQAFRLGGLGMVTLGGEPYVEGQLAVKLRSPADYTFLAHMCNYYVGYVPIREAVENPGSWDTYTSLCSKLAPEALDMIADASAGLLEKLFK